MNSLYESYLSLSPWTWGGVAFALVFAPVLAKRFATEATRVPAFDRETNVFTALAACAALLTTTAGMAMRFTERRALVISVVVMAGILAAPVAAWVKCGIRSRYVRDWEDHRPYVFALVGAVLVAAGLGLACWRLPSWDAGAIALLAAGMGAAAVAAYRREISLRVYTVRESLGSSTTRPKELTVGLSDCLYPVAVVAVLTPMRSLGGEGTGLLVAAVAVQSAGLIGILRARYKSLSIRPKNPYEQESRKEDEAGSWMPDLADLRELLAGIFSRAVHPGYVLLPSVLLVVFGWQPGGFLAVGMGAVVGFVLLAGSLVAMRLPFWRARRKSRQLRRALDKGDYPAVIDLSHRPHLYWEALYGTQHRLFASPDQEAQRLCDCLTRETEFVSECLKFDHFFFMGSGEILRQRMQQRDSIFEACGRALLVAIARKRDELEPSDRARLLRHVLLSDLKKGLRDEDEETILGVLRELRERSDFDRTTDLVRWLGFLAREDGQRVVVEHPSLLKTVAGWMADPDENVDFRAALVAGVGQHRRGRSIPPVQMVPFIQEAIAVVMGDPKMQEALARKGVRAEKA